MRWNQSKQYEIEIGYRVGNIVAVKIQEIDKSGSIIYAVAEAWGPYQSR